MSHSSFPRLESAAAQRDIYNRDDNNIIVFYYTKNDSPQSDLIRSEVDTLSASYPGVLFFEVNLDVNDNILDSEAARVVFTPSIKVFQRYASIQMPIQFITTGSTMDFNFALQSVSAGVAKPLV
ncbi:hypothetical protein DLAC_01653 [Tieghemostelium lacteum]|uniref:Thioredoxin domain-containing protein n=1 Tax=Tieghemostelium lacteum TaxID=361077 RepID=A0A152A6C5_TIELA|nr:hypothetical protein DLAC_01653 [Tieghemostelium lacteum]|eukprot:KYR01651.1 hypothetical protein DLAC_01653 [Tieghemostelium lacteum]